MKQENLEQYLNKRLKINLKNGFFYTGSILELHDDNLVFLDKNNARLLIAFSEISMIRELTNGADLHG